jgi:SMODS-associated NUDIX domain
MDFIVSISEHLIADLIWIAVASLFVARGVFRVAAWPVCVMTTVRRNSTVRFSASAVLRIQKGDEYLLVITPERGTSVAYWGPLGGVLKCGSSSVKTLYDLEVQTDWLSTAAQDMERDLRVKMRGARFWRFIRWYWGGEGRESPRGALCRELREELSEIGLASLVERVNQLEFDIYALRNTGLFEQDGIYHYRLFYVLEIVGPLKASFEEEILNNTLPGRLALVSTAAIDKGAFEGVAVGGHSAFLIPGRKYEHTVPAYQ